MQLTELKHTALFVVLYVLALGFYYVAIQRLPGFTRYLFSICSLTNLVGCMAFLGCLPPAAASLFLPYLFGLVLHTAYAVFLQGLVVQPRNDAGVWIRFRAVWRTWNNFRLLPVGGTVTQPGRDIERLKFVGMQVFRMAVAIAVHFIGNSSTRAVLQALHIRPADFHPESLHIAPETVRELGLRAVMSVHWIWSSYAIIDGVHAVCSLAFVVVLQWDSPTDWPPLFGNIADAYTVRRFWAVFWHKLHVPLYIAFLRAISHRNATARNERYGLQPRTQQQERQARSAFSRLVVNAGQALGIFTISALLHATANRILSGKTHAWPEIRFFLSTWAVCVLETLLSETVWVGCWKQGLTPALLRWLGYLWVMCVFLTLAPPWKYPAIYQQIGS